MIKGVNHQVVEVNDTACEYFERIIFFVKPEYSFVSEGKIRERAGRIANSTTLPPPTKKSDKARLFDFLKMAAAALTGAVICAVAMHFLG
ncbi:MAG: hypothetical protein ACI4GA_05625 [Acutalibacteraceae bacterium]